MTTLTQDHPTPSATGTNEVADYAPMVDFITDATAAWWSYLAGHTPEFYRERFTTESARELAQDVYAHQVEQGANEADAVAATGVVIVRNTIADVSDEHAAQLAAGLRDHVRQSVTQA